MLGVHAAVFGLAMHQSFQAYAAAPFIASDIATITITGDQAPPGFAPAILTVHVNDTVVFANPTTSTRSYQISANDGAFASTSLGPGETWSWQPNQTGAFEYHENTNVQTMVGEIFVVPANVTLLPTPAPMAVATAITNAQHGIVPVSDQNGAGTSWLLIIAIGILAFAGGGTLVFFLLRDKTHATAKR